MKPAEAAHAGRSPWRRDGAGYSRATNRTRRILATNHGITLHIRRVQRGWRIYEVYNDVAHPIGQIHRTLANAKAACADL